MTLGLTVGFLCGLGITRLDACAMKRMNKLKKRMIRCLTW